MKKAICLFLVFIMCMLVSGCNSKEVENSEKLYVMVNCEEPIKPYIILFQNEKENRFTFLPSGVSNYIAYGYYKIEDNYLTLVSDEGNSYLFRIDGTKLVFDENNSSEMTKYNGFATPTDNTVFELEN